MNLFENKFGGLISFTYLCPVVNTKTTGWANNLEEYTPTCPIS